jgi:alpha-tubulin suppressor-like RCC1 family protein
VSIAAGTAHSCAGLASGEIWCWGANQHGQLGDGTQQQSSAPVRVSFGAHDHIDVIKGVTAGHAHTCATTEVEYGIRRAYCWGSNSHGQLGRPAVGGYEDRPMAMLAFGPEKNSSYRVLELSAGTRHTCARTEGNEAWCWGDNSYGQLGDLGPASHEAVWVGGLDSGIRQITAGVANTCAVDLGLRAWCWGANTHGQLGAALPPDVAPHFFPEKVVFP